MSNNQRHFLGTLCVRIGDYENKVRYLLVASSEAAGGILLDTVAANFYGDGSAPKEDGGYYANQGALHVSPDTLREIGVSAFMELKHFLPTRYDVNVPGQPDLDVTSPEGFKGFAKSLVNQLAARKLQVRHSTMLEMLSAAFGVKNWHILSTRLGNVPEPVVQKPAEVRLSHPAEFEVDVCRIGYGARTLVVKACSAAEAKELALDEAGNHEYNEHTADYTADDARLVNR